MFINKLDEIRRAKGIPREILAKQIGVSAKTIENWEKSPESIPLGKVKELCEILEVEWNEHIFLTDNRT